MALPFSLSGIGELLVDRDSYDGFDRPQSAALVSRLGTGSSAGDQILQQGSLPFRQATIGGTFYDADDVALMRSYSDAKSEVTFTDDTGTSYGVVVFDFAAKSLGGRWDWTAVLVETSVLGS